MIERVSRNLARERVHQRLRKRLRGSSARPRLNVFRSLKHIYAQVVDDSRGHTLVAAGSLEKGSGNGGNVAGARDVGKLVAERALAKGIARVVFDRGGYKYHGRVKALAEAAREAGLTF
jgi:large subunit ribosomal protein L18